MLVTIRWRLVIAARLSRTMKQRLNNSGVKPAMGLVPNIHPPTGSLLPEQESPQACVRPSIVLVVNRVLGGGSNGLGACVGERPGDGFAGADETLHEDVHCRTNISCATSPLEADSLRGARMTKPMQYAVTASSEPTCSLSSQKKGYQPVRSLPMAAQPRYMPERKTRPTR